jgi:hypothetical protein
LSVHRPVSFKLNRCPAEQAQDLTQEFFIRVLESRYLDRADRRREGFERFF